ncbi:MAG: N-acetylmuramoyl-L-alanine amidase [Nitrospirae bacterium]|nr:MAG: N-acetylmuramoyl-L-alanine amidase [Nitrospirota bacterium]
MRVFSLNLKDLFPCAGNEWQKGSMNYDGKHMVDPHARCLRGALLLALSAALLTALPASATMSQASVFHLQSPQVGLLHLAAARSKQHSSKTATVTNLRVSQTGKRHRLVLDFAKPVAFTQERTSDPAMLVINLKNVALSNHARRIADSDKFPAEIAITQASPRQVRVVLDMEDISNVSLTRLSKPDRLVVDYVAQAATPVAAAKPRITLPPVSRQITSAERQARLDIETIVLDPGHGGKDPGAIGRDGLAEKEVVLDVALRLRDLLREHLGKKVLMTRDKDEFIELDDRAKFANGRKADLFVSIHINSHPKRATRGVEMYHFGIASDRRAMEVAARENGDTIDHAQDFVDLIKADLALSKRIEDSQNLAWETKLAVVNLVSSQYDTEDHGVKTAPFYVLRYTAMPSILAELAFISNPVEERRLRQSAFRQKAAEGLFEGIRNYLNSAQVAFAR